MWKRRWAACLVGIAVAGQAVAGQIVLENARLRAVLGHDARWRALVAKDTGKDCCGKGQALSLALARVHQRTHPADRAAMQGDRLTVGFDGCDTTLVYRVATTPDWIAFRLERVGGTRPSHVTLVRLGVTLTQRVGSRLNCAWDDTLAVCLMATSLQTHGRAHRRKGYAELTATTQDAPGPKLEGAGAALIAAPPTELRAILRKLSVACGLPRNEDAKGTPAKELPIARQSYWFLTFGEKDVDRVIDCCKRSGFGQVMMGSGSWCRTVGHYTFHTSRYPDGIESLKRTVGRLHAAGIQVGMHCFASKVSKTDAYVTPVPDRRFWVVDNGELAADAGPADDAIRLKADLSQWPGSPACKRTIWEGGVAKHQEVAVDDEIVVYQSVGPKGRWDTLLGCRRGAWGTKAAAHKAGTPARRYGVDGCINGYIIDQETTLLDETTTRLAHVFNTCGFDMLYFDGGEDVDRRRFAHYVSKFQATAMSKFTRRPLIHMGTIMTHNLWHSFTRSATVDHYLNTVRGRIIAGGTWDKLPTVRDHIDRSVRYMLSIGDDMMPGELGWFGIWPRQKGTDGLQLDEIEYLMCKSLAYDAPISLQTSFRSMEAHPLTPGILQIVKAYETLRTAGTVHETTRKLLRETGKDFILVPQRGGPGFIQVKALPKVAGTHDVRAFVGHSLWMVPTGFASVWHHTGREGRLILSADAVKARRPTAADITGKSIKTETLNGGKTAVPIGGLRTTLRFDGLAAEQVRELLANATLELRKPVTLWLQAEDAARIAGKMAKGSAVGVREPGAFGDVLLCPAPFSRTKPQPWYAEYRVKLPHKGRWTLWARVRYPSGTDHSFGIVRPGEPVTLGGTQVLGNCGVNHKKWHWTGRGGGTTSVPPGQPITFTLPKGEFVFRITPREGAGSPPNAPRLDCLCLADDPSYVPTDADARRGLASKPPP